jgi:hypothetical protein
MPRMVWFLLTVTVGFAQTNPERLATTGPR